VIGQLYQDIKTIAAICVKLIPSDIKS